ncbi:FadR/GntR family transcriptional regulator [Sphingobium sp. CR2-8]|uniref:FadR/GntR family transcriptional regulator n=1 Tax=Sphingobium sp. CR2-8 TaxID=1306534 RepID=UPI002DB8596C|nr:FadR/GntR family transcriptional regulator [Sphingobium sp. CR2-8]MEC3911864.1 FadR/GntR family transcriptional regulator [Sphingobium sp. CR2-8]
MTALQDGPERLYQELARSLLQLLSKGAFAVGDRLPAERELAARFNVSRPTVREAMIALEVQGFVEVRVGSGAYVVRVPRHEDQPGFHISAFELTEARLLFEGEAAALAASQIVEEELAELEMLVKDIEQENNRSFDTVDADRAFHLAIARATRNQAIFEAVDQLWRLRDTSPEASLLHAKALSANVKPIVDDHRAILDALRSKDSSAARDAMRKHLSSVLDSLLFAVEERAVQQARQAIEAKRNRYAQAWS